MRFKDQSVWVRADGAGKLVLDGAGRAEMKYRENDEKSYRPSASNLLPDADGGPPRDLPEAKSGGDPSARRSSSAGSKKGSLTPLRVPGAVEVWTDGACSGNPGPMGIGVVVVDGERREEVSEYLGVGTNNIAELVAIERGLDVVAKLPKAKEGKDDRARRVRVYSDSGYAIGLLEKGWKAKANQDLVARLRKQVAGVPHLEFVKVPGHAGVPENERCDALAREAITRRR
jgi:ribonuclease HI